MRVLLDTQLVLWLSGEPHKLSAEVRAIIEDADNEIVFSVVNLWEVAIKKALARPDFQINPRRLRQQLLASDYRELAVLAEHTLSVGDLPPIHRDPFDRILIAQAQVEGLTLLTTDGKIAGYPGDIRQV